MQQTFTLSLLDLGISEKDPHKIFFQAFGLLRIASDHSDRALLGELHQRLQSLLVDYPFLETRGHARRWAYGYDYENMSAGWWSGMDGLLAPLVYHTAGQMLDDPEFVSIGLASAKLALRSPLEGGVLWREGSDVCWISEYAWEGMTAGDEFHVMNGHLYGLHALYLLAQSTGDEDLTSAYSCARRGTEARSAEFYSDAWIKYQTTPSVVSPGHYFLFEIGELMALHQATGDEFYFQEAERRKSIFADRFPMVMNPLATGGSEIVVSAIGTPHPYWPDNYGASVACHISTGTVEGRFASQYQADMSFDARLLHSLILPEAPRSCTYSVMRGDFDLPIYTTAEFETPPAAPEAWEPVGEASYAAVKMGDSFRLEASSAFDEGRITYPLHLELGPNDLLALTIKSNNRAQLGILLFGEGEDQFVHRYYPDLTTDCENLVIVSRQGFDNQEKLGPWMTSLSLRIFPSQPNEELTASIANAAVLRNPLQLREYLKQNSGACFSLQ